MLRCAVLWPKYTQTGYVKGSVREIWGEDSEGKRTKYNISVYMCVAVVLSCQGNIKEKKILHRSAGSSRAVMVS